MFAYMTGMTQGSSALSASNISPSELIDGMREGLTNLSKMVNEYHDLLLKAINADNTYKELYAKAYLEVKASADKITVTEIDARVTERVKDVKLASDIADALVKALREKMDVERKSIDVAQSALAWSRAELEHTTNIVT